MNRPMTLRFVSLAVLIFMLPACASSSTPSPSVPSNAASADPSVQGSAQPSSEGAALRGLTVGGAAMVGADDVRIRATPGLAGTVLGTLDRGVLVHLTGGPESADEFDWYQVTSDTLSGWVAAGTEGSDWLIPSDSGLQPSSLLNVEWISDQASLEGANLNDVVRFGSRLVAVGNVGGASGEPRFAGAWTSTDGRFWEVAYRDSDAFPTFVGLPGVGGMVALASSGEQLVAVGGVGPEYGGNMVAAAWTSSDGTTWERAGEDSSFAGSFMLDVTPFHGGWIASGVRETRQADGSGGQTGALWSSTNGRTWQSVDLDLTGPAGAVGTIGERLVVLVGDVDPYCANCFGGGIHVFVSADGVSWHSVPDGDLPAGFGAGRLVQVGDRLVTAGVASRGNERPIGNVLFETRDGEEWRRVISGPVLNGGAGTLVLAPAGLTLIGVVVPPENGCCSFPAFWSLSTELTWEAVLADRSITEGTASLRGATLAPDGTIVAVGGFEAQSADGVSCCVIRGVIAVATLRPY